MNVLVLGGTGYLGRRIVEHLVDHGDTVSVVSRGKLHPAILSRTEHCQIDKQDRAAFEAAFQNRQFDAVIDNIAYTREDILSVIRAFGGRIGQYLFTSTMAVYHRVGLTRPLREEDADLSYLPPEGELDSSAFHPSRGQAYGIGKRQAELTLQEHAESFPFTALRAPIVVGPDDRTLRVWWFVERLQDGGPFIIPDWGYGRVFQVVYADDLAAAFVAAVGNKAAYGKAYNIAQPDILTPETWIQGFASALQANWEAVRIPEALIGPAGLEGYTMPIAGRPFGHFLMDISAARQDLGFEPTPFDNWIGATARGCAEHPPAQDSEGYARREAEVAMARRFARLRDETLTRFVAPD